MGRKKAFGWRRRIAATVLLAALGAAGWGWWQGRHWRPAPADYPVQGVLIGARDGHGRGAGSIALGLARFRRVVREYFAICDSYYKALRKASGAELETLDMARRAIHDRATRQLLDALEGKVETDLVTARRLFTLICVLHIRG